MPNHIKPNQNKKKKNFFKNIETEQFIAML